MLTFEQSRSLKVGDSIYEHTGWDGNGVTFCVLWNVTKVHPNSIDIHCPTRNHYRNARMRRSDFPFKHWSVAPQGKVLHQAA